MKELPKVSIKSLLDRCLIRLATIGIVDIYETISLEDTEFPTDAFTVIHNALNDAITEWERNEPLITFMDIYIDKNPVLIKSNFDHYITDESTLSRNNLILPVKKIIRVSRKGSLFGAGFLSSSSRRKKWENPYLYVDAFVGETVTIKYSAVRPMKWERFENTYTADSYLYFITEDDAASHARLLNYITLELCELLIRLDENMTYSSIPIEFMKGLTSYADTLRSRIEADNENLNYSGVYD
jgi:hypothetical protein